MSTTIKAVAAGSSRIGSGRAGSCAPPVALAVALAAALPSAPYISVGMVTPSGKPADLDLEQRSVGGDDLARQRLCARRIGAAQIPHETIVHARLSIRAGGRRDRHAIKGCGVQCL